jgi:hypothetical protein
MLGPEKMMQHDPSRLLRWMRRSLLTSSLLLIAACQQGERAATADNSAEMDWARAALERNPQLELVATDANARVFTVRDKQSGEVRAIKLDELAAAPVSQLAVARSPTPATTAQTTALTAQQPAPTQSQRPDSEAAPTPEQSAAAQPDAARTTPTDATSNYTIERSAGQVRVSGPGVSIVSSGTGNDEGVQRPGQNAAEPIICEGQRMVHFDNREIYVDGDAITVRGGCEMYITNSRIVASGTGVVVKDGVIHVSNSHIEGAQSSFDADSRAKVFARSSTFRGLPRRAEQALVQDQGGNRWR